MKNTKLTPKEAFETIYSRLNFLEGDCFYGEEAEIVRDALDSMASERADTPEPNLV